MEVSKQLKNCQEQDGLFTVSTCTVNELENYFQMVLDKDLNLDMGSSTSVFTVSADSAVNLPMTIKVTQPIILSS